MNCPNCNHEIEDGNSFCNMCGAKLRPEPPQASSDIPASPEPPQVYYDVPVSPRAQHGGLSAVAKRVIGIAATVIVAMVVVFVLVILPQLNDRNTSSAAVYHDTDDDRDDEDEDATEDAEDAEETGGAAPDTQETTDDVFAKEPVSYALDEIGTSQYGVFVGQGGTYYSVYLPQGFNESDLSFSDIDFDKIPTMNAGDKLVYSLTDDTEFTISPVTEINDDSLQVEGFGRFMLKASDDYIGTDIQVFDMPRNMELSYAQLYYIYAKNLDSQSARAGFTGLVFIQDTVFEQQGTMAEYNDYILLGSDSRYISESELWSLTQWQVRLARNEIYARYGYNFKTGAIQQYFESTSWYWDDPYYGHDANKPSFNKYEKYNLTLIKEYEASMGW